MEITVFIIVFALAFIALCEINDFRNQEGVTYYFVQKRRMRKNADPYLFNHPDFK